MKNSRIILSLAACTLVSVSGFAWGQKGHDTVVAIAENHFTPTTKAAVEDLLDGHSPVYYANWLDNASNTPEYAYSKTWHYKNIDANKNFDNAPKIKEGNIVDALTEQIQVLADTTRSREDRTLALKMVVHFLGDIHQPLHMGHASDRGGNQWYIKFFKAATNLHTVWDSKLPGAAHDWSYSEWVDQIDRATPEEQTEIIAGGTPDKWGRETYEICTEVYDQTPQDYNVAYDYIAKWTPTIERQFLKGGLRLADVLNDIFDPTYEGQNSVVKH